jgi:hypothetical protein
LSPKPGERMGTGNVDQNVIFPYKLQRGQGLGWGEPALGSCSGSNNSQAALYKSDAY